jgi:membrane dipeptidase
MKQVFAALVCASLVMAAPKKPRKVSEAEVRKVQRSAILIDTHNDVTSKTVEGFDIGKSATEGHTDLPRLRAGGVGAVFFAAFVSAHYVDGNRSAHRTLEMIDTLHHDIVERYPNDFVLATRAEDIVAAHKKHKIAALIGIEGGHAIEDNLGLLRDYYALGVRYMTLTHTNTNHWADSSGDVNDPDVEHHNGLTDFGKSVVREMNRLGMIVDVAHVADKTFWDALEVSKAPVFSSHSSCRALCNVPRDMTDEMIVAMAKKGGVIQINFNCGFLSQKSADVDEKISARMQEIRKKYKSDPDRMRTETKALEAEARASVPRATLDDVVAHIDHVVKIAGIEAVGIGSDFDGVGCTPAGLDDNSKYPNLTRALLEKGYSASDIRKIYGGNTLRLMRAVAKAASR